MKVAYYGYRDWSFNIFSKISTPDKYLITTSNYEILDQIKPDIVIFVGWSDIVPDCVIEKYFCVCVHPSKLPEYRGGSPIQNQIIDRVIDSAVTFFVMDKGLDTGDILYQAELSLEGDISSIFSNIEVQSTIYLNQIISDFSSGNVNKHSQDETCATFFKRRKPHQSEITIDEILNSDPIDLYNKIRCLNDPYPNAYIKCKDDKKLFLLSARYENEK